jgi:cell wall assembly regulator SMI1
MAPHLPELQDSWQRIDAWLRRHAPATSTALSPPDESDVLALEAHLGYALPPEARQWFTTVHAPDDLTFAGQILPAQILLSARSAQAASSLKRSIWDRPDDPIREMVAGTEEQPAGGMAWAWLPSFVPLSADGGGGCYFVDLRKGPATGCVKQFNRDDGALHPPVWTNLTALLADVAETLEQERVCEYFRPVVAPSGQLDWEFDLS